MPAPYLCLDVGLKRTGVALSESGILARPLRVIEVNYPHIDTLLAEAVKLVQEFEVATIIIGMPNAANNAPTRQSGVVEKIVNSLREALDGAGTQPEIVEYNEFGSTQLAQYQYPDLDDNIAAATLLLQEYLDGLA
jgi:RNase H-fold protein (predicted Holliday junction resolvase)